MSRKWETLILLSVAELLAMSLWFSATAVALALADHWQVTSAQAAWLTMAVQLGFVAGAVASAPATKPSWTAIVSHAACALVTCQ